MAYQDLQDKYGFIPANHQAPQFFPVEARRMFDEKGVEVAGYKRIVRVDTDKTLHVATDAYKVITNEDAFGHFEDAIYSSGLDTEGMLIGTDYAAEGARVFRQYLLPAHQVEVKPGVDVALRILMMNSYDGSIKFRGCAGAFNFVCANTSISGKEYASFSARHTGTVDVKSAIEGLTQAAVDHVEAVRRWKEWPKIHVSDTQARKIISALPGANPSTIDGLVHAWLIARDEDSVQGGPNLWTLHNVLTAWSTHTESRAEGGPGQIKFEREKRVAKLLEAPVWQDAVTVH